MSEKGNTIINTIDQYLHNTHVISIIGIAKNAGKTTVLNTIIDTYKDKALSITSIGLDGEKIDNITKQEKPRIHVYPGMFVITAEQCLEETSAGYTVHERTDIRTALGNIVIAEITTTGMVLVAGPSSKLQMKKALELIQKYNPFKVLIDGALFRKSIASTKVSEGVIFVTGASYSNNIKKTVKDTKNIIDQLVKNRATIPSVLSEKCNENIVSYNGNTNVLKKYSGKIFNNNKKIKEIIEQGPTHIYLPGALTDRMVEVIISKRSKVKNLEIIVQDSSFLLINTENYNKLQKIDVKISVLNPIEILFVAYNPTSPFNYDYSENEFRALLREELGFEPINVLQDLG